VQGKREEGKRETGETTKGNDQTSSATTRPNDSQKHSKPVTISL
jgi:hypothetical protein